MTDNENAAYYLTRAQQEDEAARKAVSPVAASIHRSLAGRYRAKAVEWEESQSLNVVRG